MSPSSRLHLKRTPAEQAERDLQKARKAARKAAKRKVGCGIDDQDDRYSARKRPRADDGPDVRPADSDDEYGPQPAPSSSSHRAHKPDYERIRAELEEKRFQDKLWGAMGDDDRLDGIEASMNSYAHVPRRWRGGGMERMDDELDMDPQYMQDEDYAEWVREGMWRRKHAAEHEEQIRKQAERKARLEREKAVKEETRRLERAAEAERKQKKRTKERMHAVETRELYETRWKELLAPTTAADSDGTLLRFEDVPWPVMVPSPHSTAASRDAVLAADFTVDAISVFLFPPDDYSSDDGDVAKRKKEKLRETMLRYHPDKFEGRVMSRVRPEDQDTVKEAVGIVARTLNALMVHYK